MSRFKPVWLLHLAAVVVAVAYVASMIALQRLVGAGSSQLSPAAVAFGVLAMFSVTCGFVLAFAAAVRSDAY